MDSNNKRVAFSEPFLSQRRKVLSGFSLGVVASLLFLTLLLLNTSFKVPKINLFLQRSESDPSRSNSSLSSSWHLPFSTFPSSSNASLQRIEEEGVGGKPREVNVSKEEVLENTHLVNLNENRDNASLHGENLSDLNGVVKDGELLGGKGKTAAKNLSLSDGTNMVVQKNDDNVGNSTLNGSNHGGVDFRGDCDIFDGNWVRDESKPYYPLGSCPFIDRDFDCHLNGRPDSDYVKWKWQPNGCDIPRYG